MGRVQGHQLGFTVILAVQIDPLVDKHPALAPAPADVTSAGAQGRSCGGNTVFPSTAAGSPSTAALSGPSWPLPCPSLW